MTGLSLDLLVPRGDAFRLELELDVPPGVTALLGPSGSGKSTALGAVAGLVRPARGRVTLDGAPLFDAAAGVDLPPRRRRVGLVPQDGLLFPHLDVRRNLLFGARPAGAARLGELAAALELEPLLDRAPGELSGGERQRVALGRALLADSRALLLDEPLAALDRGLRGRLLPLLARAQAAFGGPTVLVTHAVEEALALAGRVCVLDGGRRVAEGPTLEVLGCPRDPRVAAAAGVETVLRGQVVRHDDADGTSTLRVGAHELVAPRVAAAPGASASVGLRARDVIVAARPPEGLSARNLLPATIEELVGAGPVDVRARLRAPAGDGPAIAARLVPSAVRALGLEPGKDVVLIVKSSALVPLDP